MQSVSNTYRTIFSGEHTAETRLDIYDKSGTNLVHSYGGADIVSLTTTRGLFKENNPCVGSTVSSEIDCDLFVGNYTIPRMAMLKPYVRLTNGTANSEWIPKGVYWIDTRSTDYSSGVTTIHGYDAMLKGEQLFSPEQTVQDWPRTDLQVLNGCTISGRQHDGVAQKMGVTIQQSSLAMINKGYVIQYPGTTQGDGNIANGAMTVREVLSHICSMYGTNATIDEDGTMRFVPLTAQTVSSNIGQDVSSFDSIPAFDAFGQVEVVTSERESLFYPTTASGRTLTLYSPWGVQTGKNVAQNVYNIVHGYVYRPFNAENAIIDPALQLGDGVTVNGVTSVLNVINSDFGRAFTANISAPQDDEVDHEYPFTDRNTREVERIAATTQASLVVMADQIEAKVDSDELSSAITQSAGEILSTVSNNYYNKQTSVSITPNGLTVNSDGSITLSAGAEFTVSSGNFSIDENGNVYIRGTLSAAEVYASNLVYSGQYGYGGYIAAGAISDANKALDVMYVKRLVVGGAGGSDYLDMTAPIKWVSAGISLDAGGVIPGSGQAKVSWADICSGGSGGTAVFG